MPPLSDIDYMRRALSLAQAAGEAGEVPVGSVLVSGGRIIAECLDQFDRTITRRVDQHAVEPSQPRHPILVDLEQVAF